MYLPEEFKQFCKDEGIELRYPGDFMPWYKCWANGYNTSLSLFAISKNGEQLTAMGRNIKNELLKEEE